MGKVSFILSQGEKSLKPGSYLAFVLCWMQFKQKIMKQIFSMSVVSIAEMRRMNRALENWKTLVSLERSLSPILCDKLLVWMKELTGQLYGEMGNCYCVWKGKIHNILSEECQNFGQQCPGNCAHKLYMKHLSGPKPPLSHLPGGGWGDTIQILGPTHYSLVYHFDWEAAHAQITGHVVNK